MAPSPIPEDWSRLMVFVEVVRTGTLIEAGRNLGLSTPTVRRRLNELEDACGLTLMERSHRGLRPTPVGQRLVVLAAALGDACGASGDRVRPRISAVSLASTEIIAAYLLPAVCARLRATNPRLSIELLTKRLREELLGVDADVVVSTTPPRPEMDVESARLGELEVGLFAHRDYLDFAGVPRSAADLAGFSLIGAESDEVSRVVLAVLGLPLQPSDLGFRTDSMVGQIGAIRAGVGIGAAYAPLVKADRDLVRVLPNIAARLPLWAWSPKSRVDLPHVRLAFDAVQTALLDLEGPGGDTARGPTTSSEPSWAHGLSHARHA